MISRVTLSFLLLSSFYNQSIIAEDENALFQQIFGKKEKSQSLNLPLYHKRFFIADLNIKVKSDKFLSISRKEFLKGIKVILSPEVVLKLEKEITQNPVTNLLLKKYKIKI